jgi:hypothetical protein
VDGRSQNRIVIVSVGERKLAEERLRNQREYEIARERTHEVGPGVLWTNVLISIIIV